MSVIRDREGVGHDFKLGVKLLDLEGVLEALAESPIINNFPPALRRGILGFHQTVTLKDGETAEVELDATAPPIGSKVIVYEKAKSLFGTESG